MSKNSSQKKNQKLKVMGNKYAMVDHIDKGTEGTTFKCFDIKKKHEVLCAKLFDQKQICFLTRTDTVQALEARGHTNMLF